MTGNNRPPGLCDDFFFDLQKQQQYIAATIMMTPTTPATPAREAAYITMLPPVLVVFVGAIPGPILCAFVRDLLVFTEHVAILDKAIGGFI